MRCEQSLEALGLLVLGALDPAESAAVEAHLADCGDREAERRRLAAVVKLLPYALPEVEPPAALERRLRTLTAPRTAAADRGGFASGWPAWAPAAAAAALIVGAGLAATMGLLLHQQQTTQASLDAANRRASSDRVTLASFAAGPGRSLGLHATRLGGTARGIFRIDSDSGQVVLVVYGLPAAPTGRVYQGWMHRSSKRISIGVVAPHDQDSPVVVTLSGQAASLLGQVDGFGMTLEPIVGSFQPTTPPIITS